MSKQRTLMDLGPTRAPKERTPRVPKGRFNGDHYGTLGGIDVSLAQKPPTMEFAVDYAGDVVVIRAKKRKTPSGANKSGFARGLPMVMPKEEPVLAGAKCVKKPVVRR